MVYSLSGWRASDSPYATVPPSIFITPNHPDIVIHDKESNAVALLELTCPLESIHHLSSQEIVSLQRRNTNYFYLN